MSWSRKFQVAMLLTAAATTALAPPMRRRESQYDCEAVLERVAALHMLIPPALRSRIAGMSLVDALAELRAHDAREGITFATSIFILETLEGVGRKRALPTEFFDTVIGDVVVSVDREAPRRLVEIAVGKGIVTRLYRDVLDTSLDLVSLVSSFQTTSRNHRPSTETFHRFCETLHSRMWEDLRAWRRSGEPAEHREQAMLLASERLARYFIAEGRPELARPFAVAELEARQRLGR